MMSDELDGAQPDLNPAIAWRTRLPVPGGKAPLTCAWSCDGARIMLVGSRSAQVWSTLTERLWFIEWRSAAGRYRSFFSVAWSPVEPDLFACLGGDYAELHRSSDRREAALWQQRTSKSVHRQALSFSPSGRMIAVANGTETMQSLWTATGLPNEPFVATIPIEGVFWSPVDDRLVVQGPQGTFLVRGSIPELQMLATARRAVNGVVWSPDGSMVCGADIQFHTLRVWDADGRLLAELEGQAHASRAVAFAADSRLLFSIDNRSLRCWRTDSWRLVAVIDLVDTAQRQGVGLAASPGRSLLALWGDDGRGIDIYEVDVRRLLSGSRPVSRTYRNAKVVLVGETGVGKSGLGLVLSGQPYRPTDSTHARQVFTFSETKVALPDGGSERRETLLWDMAGQSGYRLIHQLHLAEAAAALVVFDARSEVDPFAGVRYWTRALRQQSDVPALLVAARTDRGGIAAGDKRIAAICDELGLAGFFETSAREGWHIPELAEAIRAAIDWDSLPLSVSTDLFETIKQFLLRERDGRRVLATVADLYRDFRRYHPGLADTTDLRASFDACVRLLGLRDLVRRLSFGDFVLLRPEMLDFYASALIDQARAQPDGLGYLPEREALAGRFPMPAAGRLPLGEERLLLIAVVEELLRHDLVLREPTEAGVDLVFPSQLTADQPIDADPDAAEVAFEFDGAVPAIYATLAVRLSRVSAYVPEEMWRNGSTYRAKVGGVCGVRIVQSEEGHGELVVFFGGEASEETRYLFEDYVHAHLTSRALPGSVRRERVFTCPECGCRADPAVVRRRLDRGATDVMCSDCEKARIPLLDRHDRLAHTAAVRDMNASADAGRDADANTATIRGKVATQDYDVFLSYNTADHAAVAAIAARLRDAGVLAWFAPTEITAGDRWRDLLEEQIGKVRAGAVFLGPHGMGKWQRQEEQLLVAESTRRDLRIIPVLLPGAAGVPSGFLAQWQAADFRDGDPDPFARLLAGVKG